MPGAGENDQNGTMDPGRVVDDLYRLSPDEFTAARDARAAEARRGGDRELAAAIKKLRRPTIGAWLANVLVAERQDLVRDLLDLGVAMRQAQAHLAGPDLRRLSQQRRQVVGALGRAARQLAADRGHRVSEAGARELEGTLEAALADADAAGELRAGHLTSPLRYAGLGPVDLSAARPTPIVKRASRPPEPGRRRAANLGPSGEREQADRIAAADEQLHEAQDALAEAERKADEQARHLRDVRGEEERCHQLVADLQRRLRDARKAAAESGRVVRIAEQEAAVAGRTVRAARQREDRARAARTELRSS
jgi:hypothetical protein